MAATQQIRFTVSGAEYTRIVKIHDAAHPFDASAVPVSLTSRGLLRSGLLMHEARLAKACRVQHRKDNKK